MFGRVSLKESVWCVRVFISLPKVRVGLVMFARVSVRVFIFSKSLSKDKKRKHRDVNARVREKTERVQMMGEERET